MNKAKWMLPVTLLLLSGLMAAQTLTSSTVVANVPFQFMVNNKVMQAGHLLIKSPGADPWVLAIGNFNARQTVMVQSATMAGRAVSEDTVLVFNHYGSRYFLESIRIAGSDITYSLPKTRAEKELLSQNVMASQSVLLASLR